MHRVTDTISIDESELSESFVRSSGPGGQNVNKVSSAVQLRFDVRASPSLPNDVAVRPVPRRATKVPKAQKRKRIEGKKHRSAIKNMRGGKPSLD